MNIGLLGTKGEEMTARFLHKNGYTVLKRNYQCRYGEIDIIAEKGEVIAFIEVKTRSDDTLLPIEYAVDQNKQKKIMLTAQDYLLKTRSDLQPRFDVALITHNPLAKTGSGFSLKYIENAY